MDYNNDISIDSRTFKTNLAKHITIRDKEKFKVKITTKKHMVQQVFKKQFK